MVGYAPQGNPLYPADSDTADLSWLVQGGSPLAPQDPGWTYGQVLPMAEQDDPQGNPHYKWAWPGAVRSLAQGAWDLVRGAHGDTGGAITPDAENALLAYAMRGLGGGRGNPNELGIFAGKGAKNPPPEGPAWSIGADDLPRFEINDANATIQPGAMPSEGNLRALLTQVHGMSGVESAGKDLSMGELLNHPELYSQYPELANLPVRLDASMGPRMLGSTKGDYSSMKINPWQNPMNNAELAAYNSGNPPGVKSPEAMTQFILHELQHVVQNKEGFAPGGNSAQVQLKLSQLAGDPRLSAQEQANLSQMAQNHPFLGYNNLAGEVEARNVEDRYTTQQMNPKMKGSALSAQGISPRSTEDVPRSRQLIFPALHPVEHNPYAPPSPTNPIPVEHDPFEGAQASMDVPSGTRIPMEATGTGAPYDVHVNPSERDLRRLNHDANYEHPDRGYGVRLTKLDDGTVLAWDAYHDTHSDLIDKMTQKGLLTGQKPIQHGLYDGSDTISSYGPDEDAEQEELPIKNWIRGFKR